MRIRILLILMLVRVAVGQNISAELPRITINDTLTPTQLALIATATDASGNCVPSTHVHCVGHDPSNDPVLNGTRFIVSGQTIPPGTTNSDTCAPGAQLAAALTNLATVGNNSDEVVVLDAGSTYRGTTCSGPLYHARQPGGSCQGNNVVPQGGGTCNWIMPKVAQADPSNPHWIIIISSHHKSFPPQGTRIFPRDGDGYSSRAGQIHNVLPSDFYRVDEIDGQAPIQFLSGANYYLVMDGEFTSLAQSAAFSEVERGEEYGLVNVNGAGRNGVRAMSLLIGGNQAFLDGAITIDHGQPVLVACHVGSATGPDCATTGFVPGVATAIYIDGLNTHFVAGTSYVTFTWSGYDNPAGSTGVDAVATCPAGATVAGNGVKGNLCVTDATHAWTMLHPVAYAAVSSGTCTASVSCFNGGVNAMHIETPATTCPGAYVIPGQQYVPGGTWAACSEFASGNLALQIWFDSTATPQFTVSACTVSGVACPQSTFDNAFLIPGSGIFLNSPANPVASITLLGASTGTAPRTTWGTTPQTTLWIGHGFVESGPSTYIPPGTPVITTVNGGLNQQITGYTLQSVNGGSTAPGKPLILYPNVPSASLFQFTDIPSYAIDVCRGCVGQLSGPSWGIDMVGTDRRKFLYVIPGQQYTLDFYTVGMNLTGISCAAGSLSPINFGQDVAIDSCAGITANHGTVTFTPCDGVTVHTGCTRGAPVDDVNHVWFMHDWAHGYDGAIVHYGGPVPGVTNVTAYQVNGTTVTMTAANSLAVGDLISLQPPTYGFPTSLFFNGPYGCPTPGPITLNCGEGSGFYQIKQVTAASPTQFSYYVASFHGTITAWSISGTTTTFTTSNVPLSGLYPLLWPVGSTIALSGFTAATFFNGQTATITAQSATSFTVSSTFGQAAGTGTGSGTATLATTPLVTENGTVSNDPFPRPAYITDWSVSGGQMTFTGNNTFAVGTPLQFFGFGLFSSMNSLNGNVWQLAQNLPVATVTAATPTAFTVNTNFGLTSTPTKITAPATAWNVTTTGVLPWTGTTTFTAANNFHFGDIVQLSGFTTAALNGQFANVSASSASSVTVDTSFGQTTGTHTETGTLTGVGAAAVQCQGAGAANFTWICFNKEQHGVQHGFIQEASYGVVADSYIDQIHMGNVDQDVQGISGVYATGPQKLHNNFINAQTEGILWGGAGDMLSNGFTTFADIEIFHNDFYKAPYTFTRGIGTVMGLEGPAPPGRVSGGTLSTKNFFEEKTGNRVHVYANVGDLNFPGPKQYYRPIGFTPRPFQGHASAMCLDVIIENNLFISTGSLIISFASDTACSYGTVGRNPACVQGILPSTKVERIMVRNNLNVMNQWAGFYVWGITPATWSTSFDQRNWIIDHNTSMFSVVPPINAAGGGNAWDFTYATGDTYSVVGGMKRPTHNIWITNNVANAGPGGSGAPPGGAWLYDPNDATAVAGNYDMAHRFKGNVAPLNNIGGNQNSIGLDAITNSFTAGNPVVASPQSGQFYTITRPTVTYPFDYTLTGPLPALANFIAPGCGTSCVTTDGKTAGVNMTELQTAVANAITGVEVQAGAGSISGTVSGGCVSGVTISLSGQATGGTLTGPTGAFSFTGLADGSYTLTPSLSGGYTFQPTQLTPAVSGGAAVAGQDFLCTAPVTTTFSISGTISGLTGSVPVNLTGAATQQVFTGAGGVYSFPGLVTGGYTVAPTAVDYTFVPTALPATIVNANVSGINFAATPVSTATPATLNVNRIGPRATGAAAPLSAPVPKKKEQKPK